jgi:hypothetical protein
MGCGSAATSDDGSSGSGGVGAAGDDAGGESGSGGLSGEAAAACTKGPQPLRGGIRRLTNTEFDRSVRDVFGIAGTPSLDHGLPHDPTVDGFVNNVDALKVSTLNARGYFEAARAIAKDVTENAELRARVVTCDVAGAGRTACVDEVIDRLTARLFRRPIEAQEREQLRALAREADADADPYKSIAIVIEALLQAPSFLYRVERGVEDSEHAGWRKLSGHEMASRLSYLIWQSPPDEALLESANRGGLDDAEGVAATAREMLNDSRAQEAYRIFYEQWLHFDELRSLRLTADDYPEWNDSLRESMLEETRRVLDDAWSGNLLDVLTTNRTYVDGALAQLYGVPGVSGPGFEQVELGPEQHRTGILTHASVLALSGRDESKAPILRGRFVRDAILCSKPPPPPDNVPSLPPAEPGQSIRERLEVHRANPDCASCHALMDPVGFGFEKYDMLGRYRETDTEGNALTGEGELAGFAPAAFTGAEDLANRVREAPDTKLCVARHVTAFALGRKKSAVDRCTASIVAEPFTQANGRFDELVLALVTSETFRFVQGGTP